MLEEKIAEVKGKIETVEAETAEEKKLRWEFLLAAVPGILALLTGLWPYCGFSFYPNLADLKYGRC